MAGDPLPDGGMLLFFEGIFFGQIDVEAAVRVYDIRQFEVAQKPTHLTHFKASSSHSLVKLTTKTPLQVNASFKMTTDSPHQTMPKGGNTDLRRAPWKVGFMQVRVEETVWAFYQGAESNHGCLVLDMSPGSDEEVWRDFSHDSGNVFYEGAGVGGKVSLEDCYGVPDWSKEPPWQLTVIFGDSPEVELPAQKWNSRTYKNNYLSEARVALAFLTTLTEEFSPGKYKHHRHFLWSEIWHIQPSDFKSDPKPETYRLVRDSGFWFKDGKDDKIGSLYLAVLNNPTPPRSTAAETSERAANHPRLREWTEWQKRPVWALGLKDAPPSNRGGR